MEKSKNNVVIIDGYGFIFRAFFSLKDFKTSKNEPVGAVYGFVNMIIKTLNTFEPEYIILVFDSGKKSFRNEIYSEYKANRKEAPEDLKPQFAIIREAAKALNIKYAEVEGFEADDLIATYAKKCEKEGFKSIIISSDKDLMQLTKDGSIEFYDPMKAKFIKEKDVVSKFGVKPLQIVDFLAIVGDASDNIPGVAGIGEKGAMELLSAYLDLEDIYNNLENITKPRLKNALEKSKDNAFLSKQLATLKCDVPTQDIENFKSQIFDKDELFDFLSRYELHSIISKLLPGYNKKQADLFGSIPVESEKEEVSIQNLTEFEKFLHSVDEDEITFDLKDGALLIQTNKKNVRIKKWWAE